MKKKFIYSISVYIILMLLDGLLTYINTPDLALEGNPLVSVFNLGWGALFTANLIALILLLTLTYYTFFKYKSLIADVKNRREYLSMLCYNRPDKWIWSLYKLPKNYRPVIACAGYVFLYSMILNRAILVFEWLTRQNRVPIYDTLNRYVPYHRMDILIAMLFMLYLFYRWFELEYRKSVSDCPKTDVPFE